MDPLQSNEAIQQFMKLLEENNRQGQAADLSQLMWYMDGMSRQYDAVLQELKEVRQQLSQVQEPSVKYVMQGTAAKLEHKAQQIKKTLDNLWEKIAECAATAVENFKNAGVSALDKAVSAIGVKNVLESLQEKISGMIADTKQSIETVESIGHELRSVGGHLKNAGRTMIGKEMQVVDGGQEGRFQSVVLAPLRTIRGLLSNMNNATLAAIGGLESLEVSAEAAREAQAERAEQRPGKRLEKKPSIRQALQKNQAEIAAKSAPATDKEKKQEAAL